MPLFALAALGLILVVYYSAIALETCRIKAENDNIVSDWKKREAKHKEEEARVLRIFNENQRKLREDSCRNSTSPTLQSSTSPKTIS